MVLMFLSQSDALRNTPRKSSAYRYEVHAIIHDQWIAQQFSVASDLEATVLFGGDAIAIFDHALCEIDRQYGKSKRMCHLTFPAVACR